VIFTQEILLIAEPPIQRKYLRFYNNLWNVIGSECENYVYVISFVLILLNRIKDPSTIEDYRLQVSEPNYGNIRLYVVKIRTQQGGFRFKNRV